ncbi:MAG: PD-(D/E)XK nuclease family protein [Chloroflexi bacterium]|nr:PD-(D/E)XK nuclease family protein [Chloroflexota bacterium]
MVNIQPAEVSPREVLERLVLDEDLERLEDLLAEFNLFDVLKVERREPQHSALLAWLLDPRGSHGLGEYFVRRFLSEAAVAARERGIGEVTPLIVDGWKLDDIEVATERHRIDIMLIAKSDQFVCLIENKVGTEEHSNQLTRYLATVEREYEDLDPFPIFLTPDGTEPESEDDAARYVPMEYGKVADLLDRTLKTRGSTISAGVAGFLEQYARTLRRHVMSTTDNIDELAVQIYTKHQAAIDLIIKAKPALEARAWNIIDGAMAQHAPKLKHDHHTKAYHRYYSEELEDIPALKNGSGWTKSNRLLLFELKFYTGRLVLVIGPGPAATRQRIYDLIQKEDGVPGVAVRRASKLSPSYHIVYSVPILGKSGPSAPDYEQSQWHVEQAITNFYANDYPLLVGALREELT